MKVKLLKKIRRRFSIVKVSQLDSNKFPETSLALPYYVLRWRYFWIFYIDCKRYQNKSQALNGVLKELKLEYKPEKRIETKVWYK